MRGGGTGAGGHREPGPGRGERGRCLRPPGGILRERGALLAPGPGWGGCVGPALSGAVPRPRWALWGSAPLAAPLEMCWGREAAFSRAAWSLMDL